MLAAPPRWVWEAGVSREGEVGSDERGQGRERGGPYTG